eukprot:5342297-Prymnesium_polylepis.2
MIQAAVMAKPELQWILPYCKVDYKAGNFMHPADDAQALEPARVATQARTGRRATWAAQGDYLLDLSTTPT